MMMLTMMLLSYPEFCKAVTAAAAAAADLIWTYWNACHYLKYHKSKYANYLMHILYDRIQISAPPLGNIQRKCSSL